MEPEDFQERLRQAGITPEKPLHAVLMTVHDAAQGARGLTVEGERALIQRVAGACLKAAELPMARRSRTLAWRSGAAVAATICFAFMAGYVIGIARPVATAFGDLPREVVAVLQANDLAASWAACRPQPPQRGRGWCYMPLWRSAPPPRPR